MHLTIALRKEVESQTEAQALVNQLNELIPEQMEVIMSASVSEEVIAEVTP